MPKQFTKYLLFLTKDYSFSVLEPIYKEIIKKNVDKIYWYSTKTNRFGIDTNQWLNTNDEVLQYNPDAIIVPGNIVPSHWPGLKVQIFHGLGEEKHGHYRINGLFDVYCTPGPYITEKFNKITQNTNIVVRETGWPKLDNVSDLKTANIKKFINSNPTILFAPTFSKKLTSAHHLYDKIKFMQKFDYNWIIKFHELMDKSLVEKYSDLQNDRFSIEPDHDILPLMAASDILLTDTSSVAYEFLLFDKPIITFRAKTRIDKGIDISSPTELEGALIRTLSNPDEFKESRDFYLSDLHPYQDGNSSARVLNVITELLNKGHIQNKSRNIVHHYNRWKTRNLVV